MMGSPLLLSSPADAASVSLKALRVASSKKGAPYVWGATGPNQFDCSGLVLFSFSKAGRRMPRTAQAQYNAVRRESWRTRRPGDLVFFHSRWFVYHVGIYAGHGKIWHAPKPGARVRLERIWSSNVTYGRVR
ncbi:C40 family peptidase [Streptomyces pathocidini]|uniref:C40 family peptidase n=1 Tax=Streptomyces pathocidini TaxID=1650571 RepID=A0ABW7UVB3_9ACTN|nr:NlpC/P60 family protein [Streptomyces pathocidini]